MLIVNHLSSHGPKESDDTFHTLFALLLEMKMFSCRSQAYFTVTCHFLFTEKPDLCQRTVACPHQLCLRGGVRPQPDPQDRLVVGSVLTHHAGPLRVSLGRPHRIAVLRHVQNIGVQLGRHGDGERRTPGKEGLTPTSWIPNQDWKR